MLPFKCRNFDGTASKAMLLYADERANPFSWKTALFWLGIAIAVLLRYQVASLALQGWPAPGQTGFANPGDGDEGVYFDLATAVASRATINPMKGNIGVVLSLWVLAGLALYRA